MEISKSNILLINKHLIVNKFQKVAILLNINPQRTDYKQYKELIKYHHKNHPLFIKVNKININLVNSHKEKYQLIY
jgi:hypothetical protein